MHIISYIHPIRTYLPCTGVGRHINALLHCLQNAESIELELLVSHQWIEQDQKLNSRCPLRELPTHTFPNDENSTERSWKLWGRPKMDSYISEDADWLYAPMETYIPVSKCPVAVTIHDVQAFEPNLPWSNTWQHRWFGYKWGRWVKRSLRDCRVVFTVSEFSKQRMVTLLNADPKKIVVVGNGVESSFFQVASTEPSQIQSPVDTPYTLVIGGLRRKKGADDVLAVAGQLSQGNHEMSIVVAGDSEAAYAEQAAHHPNVKLLGMVSDEDLPGLVRAASSLLFLSPYEGFGIPALEAMAAGIPAVVANRASLPEIVGDAGIIVEPDQHDEIVSTLMDLEGDRTLRQRYVERGRQHAAQFTWQHCADRVVTAFEAFA